MNNSLYKILKYEYKQNYRNWHASLLTMISLITWLVFKDYMNHKPFIIGGSFIPLLILFNGFITLYSYSESISRQSMEMYHLLPVSRNMKFFSKQLITFIAAPLLLIGIYLIFAFLVNPLVFGDFNRSSISPNLKPDKIALLFLWTHSFATLFAIIFKKRKLLYAMATFLGFQFAAIIGFYIWMSILSNAELKTSPFAITSNFMAGFPIAVRFLIPLLLYFISYRLFFRRQL